MRARLRRGHRAGHRPTHSTQAILSFTVGDPSQCLVQVYSDAARTQLVDDTNSTLFPGSQRCNRAGSAISGSSVSFVAGLRTSQKASDGKFHSRALAAATTYYYTITDVLDFSVCAGIVHHTQPVARKHLSRAAAFRCRMRGITGLIRSSIGRQPEESDAGGSVLGIVGKADDLRRRCLRQEPEQHRRSGRAVGHGDHRQWGVLERGQSEFERRQLRNVHRRGEDVPATSRVPDGGKRGVQQLVSALQCGRCSSLPLRFGRCDGDRSRERQRYVEGLPGARARICRVYRNSSALLCRAARAPPEQ